MAEAVGAVKQAYYTTSYTLGTGTTNTLTLHIWRGLSTHLANHHLPMTTEEIMALSGLTQEQVDHLFTQTYYQKHYGFRRFDTLEEWRAWAEEEGVLYVPAKHDPKPEPEAPADDATDADNAEEA